MSSLNMSDFIRTYYDVTPVSDGVSVDDLEDVNEFLLCDNHGSIGHAEINSLFINTFSNNQDTVLVEAIPSMQEIDRDGSMQSAWLTTSAKIKGWDSGTIKDILDSETMGKSGEDTRKIQILQRQWCDEPAIFGRKDEIEERLVNAIMKSALVVPKLGKISTNIVSKIQETFPTRMHSMIDTLKGVKDVSNRTFLIAGEDHLIETTNPQFVSEKTSLKELNEFLKSRKAVILTPKNDMLESMSKGKTELLNKIATATKEKFAMGLPSEEEIGSIEPLEPFDFREHVLKYWLASTHEMKHASTVSQYTNMAAMALPSIAQDTIENRVVRFVPVLLGVTLGAVIRLVERVLSVVEFFFKTIIFLIMADMERTKNALKGLGKSLLLLALAPIEPLVSIPILTHAFMEQIK